MGTLAEPTDEPIPLGYAGPGTGPESAVIADPAMAVLAAIQTLLAAVAFVAAAVSFGPPRRPEPWWVGAAGLCWWVAYAGGSIAMLIGSLRPPPGGRPFYRAYWFGLPAAATLLTVATVAAPHGHNPELYWHAFAITALLSPAWLPLTVRLARRRRP